MNVNYYYDWEADFSEAEEEDAAGLCILCDRCARDMGSKVTLASNGVEPGSLCDRCGGNYDDRFQPGNWGEEGQ